MNSPLAFRIEPLISTWLLPVNKIRRGIAKIKIDWGLFTKERCYIFVLPKSATIGPPRVRVRGSSAESFAFRALNTRG